jgi:hypothetical protein
VRILRVERMIRVDRNLEAGKLGCIGIRNSEGEERKN